MSDSPTFRLRVLTPEAPVFEGPVSSVVAPGVLGYLGILYNHRSLLTPLVSGRIVFRDSGGTNVYRVSGGFLEVYRNVVTVLADSAEGETA